MTDNHFVDESNKSLYATRAEAVAAPGAVYNHYKGGVYRTIGKVKYQAGDFVPQDGDDLQLYEHIFPHEHGLYARHVKDFHQDIINDEYNYEGKRFALTKGRPHWVPDARLILECDCTSYDHMLKFNYAVDDMHGPEFWIEHFVTCEAGWWNRVKAAFGYVFGNKKWLGDFNSTLLGESQLLKLKDFVDSAVAKIEKRI